MVRRAVDPGRLAQVLSPEEQTCTLWSAQRLSAAVGDEVGAATEVHFGCQVLGSGVDEHRHGAPVRRLRDRLETEWTGVDRVGQHVDHRGARADHGLELLERRGLEDADSGHTDGVVVDVPRMTRDHDLVFHSLEVRQPLHPLGVGARHASAGRQRLGGGAARGHDTPLGARELGQAARHRLHQLVELDVMP